MPGWWPHTVAPSPHDRGGGGGPVVLGRIGLAVDRHLPQIVERVIAEDHRLLDHLPAFLLLRQPSRDDGGIDRRTIVEPILAMEAPLDLHFKVGRTLVIHERGASPPHAPLAGLRDERLDLARDRVDGGFLAAPLVVHGVLVREADHARHAGHFAEAVRPLRPAERVARLQFGGRLRDERDGTAAANVQDSGEVHRKVPCYGLSSAELPTFLNHRASIFQNNSLAGSGWIGRGDGLDAGRIWFPYTLAPCQPPRHSLGICAEAGRLAGRRHLVTHSKSFAAPHWTLPFASFTPIRTPYWPRYAFTPIQNNVPVKPATVTTDPFIGATMT